MGAYILRRLILIIPTLIGILLVNFAIIQLAPGGPIDSVLAEMQDVGSATDRFTGGGSEAGSGGGGGEMRYRGAQGLDPAFIAELERQYGLDKPVHEQFLLMLTNYATFNFGDSFFKSGSVAEIIWSKLPVSLTLGFWTLVATYAISIPLGIRKAIKDGEVFDAWTSMIIIIAYSIPTFLVGVLLLTFFAGGSYFQWFPLSGLTSDNWDQLSWAEKVADYFWHIALPVIAMSVSGFATLSLLTKNSFLDEIRKQYVMTARAKGLSEGQVLYGHVFRNAMLIIIAGFPAAFLTLFTTGALLIETVFNLDGLGLLGYEAIQKRDFPIVFGTLFIFSLAGLLANLITDITYTLVDPRIDFEARR